MSYNNSFGHQFREDLNRFIFIFIIIINNKSVDNFLNKMSSSDGKYKFIDSSSPAALEDQWYYY